MHSRLLSHVQRHLGIYKHLAARSAAAATLGAVAAIVYDNLAPHPWDVYLQEQQQAIQTTTANQVSKSPSLRQAMEPISTVQIETGDSNQSNITVGPRERRHEDDAS